MRLILQHWTGEPGELERASFRSVGAYAAKVGAGYSLILGQVFRGDLSPPCQKVYMLDAEFDQFDTVVMLDSDMFVRTDEDLFDVPGVGLQNAYTKETAQKLARKLPHLTDPMAPYWGGAVYKMDRELRRELRSHLPDAEVERFNTRRFHEDEGIMHRLASMAGIRDEVSIPSRWALGNWEDGVEDAAIVHIRPKARGRPRSESKGRETEAKLENYKELVRCGILT